jgi:hypothetical protein
MSFLNKENKQKKYLAVIENSLRVFSPPLNFELEECVALLILFPYTPSWRGNTE